MFSDTRILKQQRLQCNSRDTSVLYILICKRRNNFLAVLLDLLNGLAGVHPTSEVITETAKADVTICSSRPKKTENKTNYGQGKRKSQFRQFQISG